MLKKLKHYWDNKERTLVTYRECVYKSFEHEEDISDWLGQTNLFKVQLLDDLESTSLNDLLQINKHLQILGFPGSGKSTLIKYLAAMCVKGQIRDLPNLPVIIPLISYQPELLLHTIQKQFNHFTESAIAEDDIKALLLQGKILLLLDGLDECAHLEKTKEHIQRFVYEFPVTPIIVTSRYKSSSSIPGFKSAQILPLEQEEIRIISSTLCSKYKVDSQKLWLNLISNSTLCSLAENPFQLQVIVKIYKEQDQKPISINNLLNLLLSKSLQSIPKFKRDEIFDLATKIAIYLEENKRSSFNVKDIKRLKGKKVSKVNEEDSLLQGNLMLLCKMGVLDEENGRYRFIHLLLQEYFASKVSSSLNTYELMLSLENEDEITSKKVFTRCLLWDEKIDTDNLIAELLKSNNLQAKSYVADLLIDNPTTTNTHKLVLNYLLKENVLSTGWVFRTCDALASLNNHHVIEFCRDKLSREKLTVWESTLVAYLLSMQGNTDNNVLEFLFTAARDSDPSTRIRAYRALFATKSNAALVFIIDRMKNEQDDDAYEEIISGLANISDLDERIPPSSYTTMLADLGKRFTASEHSINDRLSHFIIKFVTGKSQDRGNNYESFQ